MYKFYLGLLLILAFNICFAQNQNFIELHTAKFATGNQENWKDNGFDDSNWKTIKTNEVWQNQGFQIIDKKDFQVWVKPLADGSKAVGIFNLNDQYANYTIDLKNIGINKASVVRNVWTQKNISNSSTQLTFNIPPHGVRLLKISN